MALGLNTLQRQSGASSNPPYGCPTTAGSRPSSVYMRVTCLSHGLERALAGNGRNVVLRVLSRTECTKIAHRHAPGAFRRKLGYRWEFSNGNQFCPF